MLGKWLNKRTLWESLRGFGSLFLPVVALGHLAKAVLRIASRLPYYPLALRDPVGYAAARSIAAGEIKVRLGIADALTPWTTAFAILALAGALIAVWAIGLQSPAYRPFGRGGRAAHLAVATLYGAALVLIVGLAGF